MRPKVNVPITGLPVVIICVYDCCTIRQLNYSSRIQKELIVYKQGFRRWSESLPIRRVAPFNSVFVLIFRLALLKTPIIPPLKTTSSRL